MLQNKLQFLINLVTGGSLFNRLLHGAALSVFSNVCYQFFSFLVQVVVARMIGITDYGVFAIVYSTNLTFGMLFGYSLGLTITRYVSRYRESDPEAAGKILSLCTIFAFLIATVVAVLTFCYAEKIAGILGHRDQLVLLIKISAVFTWLTTINQFQIGVLYGFEDFKGISKINLQRGFFCLIAVIGFTFFLGVRGALIGHSIVAIFFMLKANKLIRTGMLRFVIRYQWRGIWSSFSLIVSYTLPSVLSSIVPLTAIWIQNVYVVSLMNGYAEMGALNACRQIQSILTFIPVAASNAFMPIFSSLEGSNASEDWHKSIKMANFMNQVIVLGMVFFLIVGAPFILSLYGKDFMAGTKTLIILVAGTAIGFSGNVLSSIIQSKGLMWLGFTQNLFFSIISLGLSLMLVSRYGIVGVSLGVMAAYMILNFIYTPIMVIKYNVPKSLGYKIVLCVLIIFSYSVAIAFTHGFYVFYWQALYSFAFILMSGIVLAEEIKYVIQLITLKCKRK